MVKVYFHFILNVNFYSFDSTKVQQAYKGRLTNISCSLKYIYSFDKV